MNIYTFRNDSLVILQLEELKFHEHSINYVVSSNVFEVNFVKY